MSKRKLPEEFEVLNSDGEGIILLFIRKSEKKIYKMYWTKLYEKALTTICYRNSYIFSYFRCTFLLRQSFLKINISNMSQLSLPEKININLVFIDSLYFKISNYFRHHVHFTLRLFTFFSKTALFHLFYIRLLWSYMLNTNKKYEIYEICQKNYAWLRLI